MWQEKILLQFFLTRRSSETDVPLKAIREMDGIGLDGPLDGANNHL